jgi:hypothetical protein
MSLIKRDGKEGLQYNKETVYMQKLIFSSGQVQSGFTNASTSASNDKDSSTIIREILQNSYDSAINEANEEKAKVKFILDYIEKDDIPGIKEYIEALEAIEKEDLSAKEQEQDILNTIKEQLESEEIPVLHVLDNGIGFSQNKLVAILSDGISDKDNPNDAGGSYGNGHFSAFNISNLRYVLYGGQLKDGTKLCSGQALLRTHKKNGELKLGTGFLLTDDKPILEENDIFYKNDNIPKIISDNLNEIESSGAVVSILGFNFFGGDETQKVVDLISSSIVRNFYVAIYENNLEVEIIQNAKKVEINRETLNQILEDTKEQKSTPSYNIAKQFYDMLDYGHNKTITTCEGDVKVYYKLSDTKTKLAICRNGMWIKDSIPSPLQPRNFIENKTFNALIVAQKGTNFSTLIRRAEGHLHNDIKLDRFSIDKAGKEKRKKLSNALIEIKDFLINIVEKNDNDSFEVDIPELSISMVGDSKTKKEQSSKRKSNKTKKQPRPQKPILNSDEKSKNGKGKKDRSQTKQRVGNPFDIANFSSCHNPKTKIAKVRFVPNKNATNLLLCLRLEDGTDITCDSLGISQRLKIIKATSNEKEYPIVHDDTIDFGKVDSNTLISLDIEYETNIKGDYIIDYEFLNSALKKDNK